VAVTGVVRAAGGLVSRRRGDGELDVVVVHRVVYGDWTFPKGKAHEGESDEEAALREVEEETSLRCELVRDLGTTAYRDARDRPKSVHYWEMAVLEGDLAPANEIDVARWCGVREARSLLTYERDRELLDRLSERA
jgi:8-oxo-dGTP pyrophosphatase MutT (NUDIX family)